LIHWRESPTGFVDHRYEIVREDPFRWRLSAHGRKRSWHRTASAAKVWAERLERIRRRNVSLIRVSVALGSVIVLFVVVVISRTETNSARSEAEALVTRMEEAFTAMEDGVADDFAESEGRVHGATVTLPTGEELAVLLGEAGGECYVLFWGQDGSRRARVLADSLPCEPGPVIASPNQSSYVRQTPAWSWHLPWLQGEFDWDTILPSETRQRTWFIPSMLLLSAAAAGLLTRTSVILLTGSAKPADT